MSTSASKKRNSDGKLKTGSSLGSPPVIFKQPGFNVDVRLNVFGKEFHVHSIILRLYSAYFRKFLDSADKKPAPSSALFKYEYVSVVDNDGEWGLEVGNLNSSTTSNNRSLKKGRTEKREIAGLRMLLSALYTKSYEISNYKEFDTGYRLAGFYCALPKFSASLDSAIRNSPDFIESIESNSKPLLVAAKKLRHPILFRECLVYEVARRDYYKNHFDIVDRFSDKDLQCVVLAARNNLQDIKSLADLDILSLSPRIKRDLFDSPEYLSLDRIYEDYTDPTINCAWIYRRILIRLVTDDELTILGEDSSLLSLLSCNLLYNIKRTVGEKVGHDGYDENEDDERFYCAEIADKHLPWDKEEIDW